MHNSMCSIQAELHCGSCTLLNEMLFACYATYAPFFTVEKFFITT